MRVLMLTQVAPYPPDAGPKVKTYYLLKKLAALHEIELVTFARDERERDAARELESLCARVTTISLTRSKIREPLYAARGWSRRQPFLVVRDFRREMAAHVERRLAAGGIDVIHADQLSMAQFLPARSRKTSPARTVFDAHNAVWKLVQTLAGNQPTPAHRAAAAVEWRMLRRFEGHACRDADLTLAVSPVDVSHLRDAAGGAGTYVVAPIGVEVQDTDPVPFDATKRRMLSVATMHYPPNADAIRWMREMVWPLLTPAERSAGFDIIGNRPPADLVAWSEADDQVTVHGFVPDLTPHLHEAGIFVVPLQAGSGIRVKILEALAYGLPVVSTSIGVEGLPVESGKHLLIADSGEGFADAIRTLLDRPDLRREIGVAGRAFALSYDWRTCLEPVVEAYDRLALPPTTTAHRMNDGAAVSVATPSR